MTAPRTGKIYKTLEARTKMYPEHGASQLFRTGADRRPDHNPVVGPASLHQPLIWISYFPYFPSF